MGSQSAPPALRTRVQALMEQPVDASPSGGWRWRIEPQHYRLAAAASLMIVALGIMTWQIRQNFFPTVAHSEPSVPAVVQFPHSFAMSLVRAHDNCARLADHHLIAGDDFTALQQRLTQDAGVSVFAAALGDEWKFKGAGLCTVEETRAAHLLFARDNDIVSIFSLPAPQHCGANATNFAEMMDGHPLAGFRNGDTLYCVVGSSTSGACNTQHVAAVMAMVQQTMCPGSSCQITPDFARPMAQ